MPRTARFLQNGFCYHVASKSFQKRKLFVDDADYRRYLRLLKKYKLRQQVKIFGFCLLPMAVHLILQPKEAMELSQFMQGITHSYSLYFNTKYQNQDRLWQGRFKSVEIGDDKDLIQCIKYIEFQPVLTGLTPSPVFYPWSSCGLRISGYNNGLLDARAFGGDSLARPIRSLFLI